MLCGRARVIEVTSRHAIASDDLAGIDFSEDIRVLIKTHNSRLWGSYEFHQDYVGLTEEGARLLVERGVKVLGVDYLSVEQFKKPGAPAHHVLLGGGTIVIEGLNLRDVEPGIYDMYCLPLPIVGSDGAPARVVLRQN
jgi:arylformamidase